MNTQPISSYRLASRWSCGIVIAIGLLVLMGWLFDIPALTSILPGLATMKANSAIAFVLAGVSLWQVTGEYRDQRSNLIAKVCASLTMLLGLLTLGEYIFGRDFGIDQLLFKDKLTPQNAYPGRMPPATALNLFLLGCALLMLDSRWGNRLYILLTSTALLIAGMAVIGYLYNVTSLYKIGSYASVALHTAITALLLALGILSARPKNELLSPFTNDNPEGTQARRLLLAAIGIPLGLDWLRLTGQRMGLYDTEFGEALFALSNVIIFSVLIWWNAKTLHRLEVERGQAEKALSLSEQRSQALIENSSDAIALFGTDGSILYGSPSTPQIIGYSVDEFVGRNAFELIHPEDQALVTERMKLSLQQPGAHVPVYARVRHKNGEWRWLEGVFTNLLHEPSVQAIVNNYHDSTERKQAEEVIRGSEERFRLIVEAAPSAMIAVDPEGKIDLVNAKAQDLFGYRKEELLGRPVEMLVPQRFRSGHANYRQSFLAQPTNRPMGAGRDLFGLHKDGHEVPIEIGLTPYESSDGLFTLALIVDITERKRAEEKIAYQAYLLENVNDAVIGSDENSLIRFWNQGAERIFGWKAEELLGRSGREILQSEFINTDRETVLKILAEQGRWRGEAILYRKDGSQVIMEVSSITLRDANGLITGYVSVNRDITERKQAEAHLQANATRALLIAELSQGFAELTDDYQSLLDLAARRIAELIGDYCAIRLVGADDVTLRLVVDHHLDTSSQEIMHQFIGSIPQRTDEGITAQVFRSGKAVFLPFVSPDAFRAQIKSEFHPLLERLNIHSVLIAPLRAEGKIIGTITLSRDQTPHAYTEDDQIFLQDLADRAALAIVSARLYMALQQLNTELEQRVAERTAALSQANALLQMLLDYMPDHIYFKDTQSRFIRNSRSQARALGLNDPAEAVGKSDFDFFPHAQVSYEKEQEIIRSGKPLVDLEERVVWPDDRESWVSTTKAPLLDQAGQIIGTFGISRDITERKQAETALQKAKLELEAANRELEAFSYSVSHDLRAPLRSVDGFSQALLEDYGELLPTEGRNFLERMRSSAQRMAQLIDDLLNLSKVTRAPMKLVPVDLSQLAQGIVADLQRTHRERRVNFDLTPNLKARGDPGLLQAVLENLLNNAWKFTAKREQAEIEFGSKHENGETVYFIRDNGAGFDMTYVGKLFGAFQRLHAMTEFSGTGIGLATVQRIINRHGGRVWAEGAVDQGATFFFTLPALERAKPEALPQEKESIARRLREII